MRSISPLVGYTPVGRADDVRPQHQHDSRGGIRRHAREPWREDHTGRTSTRARAFRGARTTANVLRAGYGVSALGLPSSWGQALPDPADSADHPGVNGFAPTTVNLTTGMPLPALRADSASRYPRRDAAAREKPSTSSTRTGPRGTLHSFNVAYQRVLAAADSRRKWRMSAIAATTSCAAYNMNAGHVSAPTTPAGRFRASTGEPPTRSTPQPVRVTNTTRCRSRSTAACEAACCSPTRTRWGARYSFSNGDGWRDDLYAGRLGARLSADDVRLDAQLRQQFRLHASVGTRRQVDAGGRRSERCSATGR